MRQLPRILATLIAKGPQYPAAWFVIGFSLGAPRLLFCPAERRGSRCAKPSRTCVSPQASSALRWSFQLRRALVLLFVNDVVVVAKVYFRAAVGSGRRPRVGSSSHLAGSPVASPATRRLSARPIRPMWRRQRRSSACLPCCSARHNSWSAPGLCERALVRSTRRYHIFL